MPIATVSLPDGVTAYFEVPNASADSGREQLISARDAGSGAKGQSFALSDIEQQIEGIARVVLSAIKKVSPKRATVEMSCDIQVGTSGLVAVFVRGGGKATFSITLEWEGDVVPGK